MKFYIKINMPALYLAIKKRYLSIVQILLTRKDLDVNIKYKIQHFHLLNKILNDVLS